MRFLQFFNTLWLILLFGTFVACNDEEAGNAHLVVRLTDAPADYQEVNIDIQSIEVHTSGSSSGWVELDNISEGVYNLLDLTNGLSVVLGEGEIPAGKISQIRLILGDNNTLKTEGQVHDLTTPSAQQSGLKLQMHNTLAAGITYEVLLDFDAARSVVETGSGSFNLKPVIRAIAEAQDGAIAGSVLPLEASPAVYAIQGSDTITSAFTNNNGDFLLSGLDTGSYTVGIEPADEYQEISLTDVQVSIGQVTDVGTVQLSQ
ncbi:MAG: hypothetical protein DHS20C17_12260 [Cyclobacteriaceae bacterium]|nr:MAG: hypothetical protein DHS20C17_12260 [Cyclobacteriaceae bacterium]